MGRPGVMIYFDIRPALGLMTMEQRGILFDAILEYAECGVEPTFCDDTMKMAWAFVRPRTDRDGMNYNLKVAKSKYAVYCREAKKEGKEPLSFTDWKEYLVMRQCQEE